MRRPATEHGKRSQSYRKQIVEQPTTSKIKQGIVNLSTNISFKFGGGLTKLKSFLSSDSEKQYIPVYIHGKQYASDQYAKNYMKKIIWFSYRKIPGLCKELHSDTGWGCLIRVGQMAMAAGLKAYLEGKKDKKHLIDQEIIIAFVENGGKQEKYSLKKIVEEAYRKYNLQYGKWFNVTQICDVLVSLHARSPMKGTQNLQVIHFNGAMIYLDSIFMRLGKKICNCQKRRVMCQHCNGVNHREETKPIQSFTSFSYYQPRKQKPFFENANAHLMKSATTTSGTIVKDKKLLMFVSCRPGVQIITQSSYDQIIEFLSLECSLGIVGGIPKKGFYFVGYSGNELVYLDPHYVQEQVTLANLYYLKNTFESKQMRKVGRSEIDTSMAFVFYIDGLQSLRKFHQKLSQMAQKYQNPILMIEWVDQYKSSEHGVSKIEQVELDGDENEMQNSFIEEL